MQLALPSHSQAAYLSRLMIAGAGMVSAGLLAMSAPTSGPIVEHHDVKLVVGGDGPELDFATVLAETNANLTALQANATQGSTDLSTALGNVSENISTRFTEALAGFQDGVQNALYGGFYSDDDGYVFGLFGGTVDGAQGPMTNSLFGLLSDDFAAGNTEQAFSDLNAYELEVTDHTLFPLLSPFVDETDDDVDPPTTTIGIPAELSQIQTNLLHTFANYDELKDGLKALLSPEITAQFALTKDLDAIAADFAGGNSTQGMSDLNNLSSDVFGAFVNGYDVGENPINGDPQIFAGLLGDGGLFQHLLLTYPEQIVAALGSLGDAPAAAGDATAGSIPDLFSGLLGF